MVHFTFDNGTVEPYTIILSTRDYTHLGQICNINPESVNSNCNLNSADELSFEVYKELDGKQERLWNEIFDFRLVYVKELNEYFEINVESTDQVYLTKTITATSLCECELSQTYLHNIEINTADDIAREDYDPEYPTLFYRIIDDPGDSEEIRKKKRQSSFLHRILEKVPAYSIKHVDSSLQNLMREFSISDSTVYDFLTGDCAEQFNCIFIFDSTDRSVSVYDLYTVCNTCGHRGDFEDICPECGSTDLKYFGEDTTVFISTENLTDEVNFETDTDSIKNCFRLEAGDDDMTAAVVNSNPNGSRYIYEFSEEARKDMPSELVALMDSYDEEYARLNYEEEIILNETSRTDFNNLINKYNSTLYEHETWNTIPSPIIGYSNLIPLFYECIDFESYLNHSMMPPVYIEKKTVSEYANVLNELYQSKKIGVASLSKYTSTATINSAVLSYSKVEVNSGIVKLSIVTDDSSMPNNYDEDTHIWTGVIKVTSYENKDDIAYTEQLNITITADYATFIEEKIRKQLLRNGDKDGSLYNVLGIDFPQCSSYKPNKVYNVGDYIFDYDSVALLICNTNGTTGSYDSNKWDVDTDNLYINSLKRYCANRLQSFHDAIEAVIGILIDAGQGVDGAILKEPFYDNYYQKLMLCEKELNLRNREIEIVNGTYSSTGDIQDYGILQYIKDEIFRIQKELDFKEYIYNHTTPHSYDLYNVYTTYIREDTYSNSNYISDGLTNDQLFNNAKQFLERASEELHKSATYQHSIKTNLNNLLCINEFKPIIHSFELGNWIRVKHDDSIYRLRLISYSVDFGNITKLDTEFSDVTKTANGLNDINSILKQASGMASSYGYVQLQAESGNVAKAEYIDKWIENGLNSALVRINSNNDEDITIDSSGLTAKTYDDVLDDYEDEQLRLTHNVLAFTDDKWKTVKTALGKFDFTRHQPLVNYVDIETADRNVITGTRYGLVAQSVLAGEIVGSHIESSDMISGHIQNITNSRYIDLTETITGDVQNYFLKCGNYFNVTKDGIITSTSGRFNCGVNGNYIDLSDDTSVKYFNFSHTDYTDPQKPVIHKTYLDKNAKFYCDDVEVTGSIKATTGYIGGWEINDDYNHCLSYGNIGQNNSMWLIPYSSSPSAKIGSHSGTDWAFTVGSKFGITNSGVLHLSNGYIYKDSDNYLNLSGDGAGTMSLGNGSVKVGSINNQYWLQTIRLDMDLGEISTISGYTWCNASFNNCIYKTGGQVSDARKKHDIELIDLNESVNIINSFIPKKFKFNNGNNNQEYGVIAQELRENLKNNGLNYDNTGLVYEVELNKDGEKYYIVQYTEFIPHLINIVKDQKNKISQLQLEISEIKQYMKGGTD